MPKTGQTLGPRIKDDERVDLAGDMRKDYELGQSIRAIAGGCGHSYGLTRTLLLEAGASLRKRGGVTTKKTDPPTA